MFDVFFCSMVAIDNVLARKITKLMSVRSEKTEKMQELAPRWQ